MRIHSLDGLRAVAILCVFLHHQALLKEGWVGVDLFFVLSGFLITGILRRARNNQAYWKPFYLKRAARIMPPVLLLVIAAAIRYHLPLRVLMAYTFFMGNFAQGTRYANTELGLMWSLAVEEHFYLVFPFAVRYLSKRVLMRLLVSAVCLEPLARALATPHYATYIPIYFFTYFHLDGLCMGALLALLAEDPEAIASVKRYSAPLGILAVGLYLGLTVAEPVRFSREVNGVLFNSLGYTLVSLTSLAVISYVLWHEKSLLRRILEWRPLVFLGVISYSFYLYHQVLQLVVRRYTHFSYHRAAPIVFVVATGVSWLSFHFYEQPIMRWGHRLASRYAPDREASAAYVRA